MIKIAISISIIYILRATIKRSLITIQQLLSFERMVEIFSHELRERDCPDLLRSLYGKILEYHNKFCVFESQKKRIKQLLALTNAKIMMKEI